MKFKISKGDSNFRRHRLIGVGRKTTQNNKIKAISKSSTATIEKILSLPLFELENNAKCFHPRDNIILIKEKYTNDSGSDHIYYATELELYNVQYLSEDGSSFDLVSWSADQSFGELFNN